MSKEMLELGKIVAIHALQGEVRIQPWCDSPDFVTEFDEVYMDGKAVKVLASRPHKNVVIVKFDGIHTPEEAQKLVNKIVFIQRDQIELAPNTYFIVDLIGLQVVDADDETIVYGTLTDVSPTGANDIYHIRFKDGKERYVPAIPQVVIETDLAKRKMRIRPLEGLFDD
ncbi:MAG: ribosome maturation factor RimM [Oscillospiraceae bacterium]